MSYINAEEIVRSVLRCTDHYRNISGVSHYRAQVSRYCPLDDIIIYSFRLDWLSLNNRGVHWSPLF